VAVLDRLIGQEQAAARLAAAASTPVHAYLFAGPPGSGKRNAARVTEAATSAPVSSVVCTPTW
jgi:DNA polymerase III gamma/tau subunit